MKIFLVGRRSSLRFGVVILVLFLPTSVDMEDSSGSFASSPDPVEGLAADVMVLRRKVRRQGNCLQQIDVLGGRRLDQVEEDIGRIRTEFQESMRTLEAKVKLSLDHLDNRLQSLEQKWSKRREIANAGIGFCPHATNLTSGVEVIRH